MSDDTGDDNTQNGQSGNEGDQKPDTSTLYSKAYNEGKGKTKKDVLSKFESITGTEADSLDSVFSWMENSSSKLADSISDPTQTSEYKNLQGNNKELKDQLSQTQQELTQVKNQYKFDSAFSETSSEIRKSSKFKIPENDVRDLFFAKHDVEYRDGSPVIKKGDTMLVDDSGNPKSLNDALMDFSKSYVEPIGQGTGGGSGDGSGSKPSWQEYKALNKAGKQQQGAELYSQAKQAGGWQEPDAPAFSG